MRSKHTTLLIAGILLSTVAVAELHTPQCIKACPDGAPQTNDVIVRSIYTLSSNDTTRFADWVAYRVTPESIGPSRKRKWMADPVLEDRETLEPDDYRGANRVLGTDRGHLAPLASFSGTAKWYQTNYLSNITPQEADLNRGPWMRLESAVRAAAEAQGATGVYVLTGTLYERPMPALPGADEPHLVPSGYWKTVAIKDAGQLDVAGFIFSQEVSRHLNYCNGLVPLDEIYKRSHLNLYPEVARDALVDRPANLLRMLKCNQTEE